MADYKVVDTEQLDADLGTIADAIRAQTGKTEQIPFPDGFASAPAELVEVGKNMQLAECQSKHYATAIQGNGSDKLTFFLPFEPDIILISGLDPTSYAISQSVMTFIYDIRAYGLIGGVMFGSYETNIKYMAMTTESAKTRYSRDENGFVTIQNFNPTANTYTFTKNVMYSITAVKYTDKTDKERITEMVNGLTGSGKLTMNRAKVNAAFTTEEWDALIATKPNWTFAFI